MEPVLTFRVGPQVVMKRFADAAQIEGRSPRWGAVEVPTFEAWVVKPLRSGWVAAYRVVLQEGFPVVGEMRVYPKDTSWPHPGEWPGSLHGFDASVPKGGLTASIVRLATPGRDMAKGYGDVLDRLERDYPGLRQAVRTRGLAETEGPPRPAISTGGRRGHSIRWFAQVAEAYAQRSRVSRCAVADVAGQFRTRPAVIRNAIYRARLYEFLSPTLRGRQGGQLTPKGREALGNRLPRIATNSKTGGVKGEQVLVATNRKARQSARKQRRAYVGRA